MIITRAWLNEWIDIKKISSEDICSTLNAIGLEVDSINRIRVPKNIVVARVLTCKKHPDADKLNICQVDLGSETKQIVCGAKNVREGLHVVVSKVGAILPNGMEIKEAKLRGEESSGMICSSEELGLPKMGDGIMELDDSIGELILGKEFSEYELVNDDVIEIELTANRGDCLSVHGVARDLSVPYDLDIKHFSSEDDDNQLGIGRVLNVSANEKVNASLLYRVYEKEEIKSSFLIDLRLAIADNYKPTQLERVVEYATYTTGVLLRTYNHACFTNQNDKATVKIKKHTNGLDAVYNKNNQITSYVGISQNEEAKASNIDQKVILEANYTHPEIISVSSANKKLESDRHLYRSSRGSEPDLDFGMDYLIELLKKYSKIMLYAGSQQVIQDVDDVRIPIDLEQLRDIIGEEIPKNKIIQILKRLGFEVVFKSEQSVMNVKVPQHRHDILNIQDVCEEIVRIVGIDNITSKPLVFAEKEKMNDSYQSFQKRKMYRHRAVSIGFFETLHFVFDSRERMENYGLKTIYKKREITNPITNELNTLRSSLIPNLLESVNRNVKFGRKSIKLFEVGTVFDKSRNENTNIAFIFSGETEAQKVSNHGKPAIIDFFKFAEKISNIIGSFELESSTCRDSLSSPYEYARVIQKGNDIGYISRVHLNVERELDIARTYICELDMNALSYERKEAKKYSSFPESVRDLSLMVPKEMQFSQIKNFLNSIAPVELTKLYPIDIYEDESFEDKISLTIKFHFQSEEKTFEDEDVSKMVDSMLNSLKEKYGITVR
ncbi:phenylalanine--tRNA ligase subunit beta [Sulfurospirillum arcachonense]|uniref:phenylalanine--tRNA ligase subunit beta n=1 Tax=Sulfurospirillum arcachonense TaxID=57666 RepID=UPI0004693524|nr:phenylalanine--tRNA ligase subunit beta [Sulfurospirillum arcachonense]